MTPTRAVSPYGKTAVVVGVLFLAATATYMVGGVLRLLGDGDHLAAFDADPLHARAMLDIGAFGDIWNAGLGLFGLHLLVMGYLAYRSGYVPRLLGVLVAIAGFGYLFDSVMTVLAPGTAPELTAFTWVGEFLLALWLVTRGRRIDSGK